MRSAQLTALSALCFLRSAHPTGRPATVHLLYGLAMPPRPRLPELSGHQVNQLPAALLAGRVLTGLTSWTVGTGWNQVIVSVHAVLGLTLSHDGEPLRSGHGAPVRVVAPGRRGPSWVKWVTEVELSDRPWWFQPPLPTT